MIYRAFGSAVGACPPEAARKPSRDPCSVKYLVDLPLLGEEEVEIPLEQLTNDILNSAVRNLPKVLPQVYREATPYVEQIKRDIQEEVDELFQGVLDKTLRPEIEAQKAQLLSDINRELNKYLLIVLGLSASLYAINILIFKRRIL
jgi:hypothetical protein